MKSLVSDKRNNEDDKAKLAYALTKRMPAKDGFEMVQQLYGLSLEQARILINKGRRLDGQSPPPIKTGVR